VIIKPAQAKAFMDFHGYSHLYTIGWSYRQTTTVWGTAWPKERRAIIYRWTVDVFLHELAHLIAGPECIAHGAEFAKILDELIVNWFQHSVSRD
jgi:hypothetical protein